MEQTSSAAQAMMLHPTYHLTHCHLGQPSLARLYQVLNLPCSLKVHLRLHGHALLPLLRAVSSCIDVCCQLRSVMSPPGNFRSAPPNVLVCAWSGGREDEWLSDIESLDLEETVA